MITVIIAEDHPITRQSIRRLLNRADDLIIIGEAADGAEAFALVNGDVPDVLVTDIFMPNLTGLDVIKLISRLKISTRVVAISMYDDESLIQQASKVGAHAFISKRELAKELLPAIRDVAGGKKPIDSTSPDGHLRRAE